MVFNWQNLPTVLGVELTPYSLRLICLALPYSEAKRGRNTRNEAPANTIGETPIPLWTHAIDLPDAILPPEAKGPSFAIDSLASAVSGVTTSDVTGVASSAESDTLNGVWREPEFAAVLQRIFREHHPPSYRPPGYIVLALSEAHLLTRVVRVPTEMLHDVQALEEALLYFVAEQFADEADLLLFDYAVMSDVEEVAAEREMLITLGRTDELSELSQIFRHSGLPLSCIEPTTLSANRFLRALTVKTKSNVAQAFRSETEFEVESNDDLPSASLATFKQDLELNRQPATPTGLESSAIQASVPSAGASLSELAAWAQANDAVERAEYVTATFSRSNLANPFDVVAPWACAYGAGLLAFARAKSKRYLGLGTAFSRPWLT